MSGRARVPSRVGSSRIVPNWLRAICLYWGFLGSAELSRAADGDAPNATYGGARFCPPSRRANLSDDKPPSTRVVDDEDDRFDEVVALGREGRFFCSGVLISPQQVLTAAHCLPVTEVLFGHDVQNPIGRRAVTRAERPRQRDLDAAVVWLDQPVGIPPAELRAARNSTPPIGLLRPVGFGVTFGRGARSYGRKHYLEILATGWGCDRGRSRDNGCTPEWEMVLPRGIRSDTCDGDSGGPVFEPTRRGPRVVAITSRSVEGARAACGDGGIYLRIDRVRPWLDEILATAPEQQKKAEKEHSQ